MICFVVGARPNFMKMAPVVLEARRRGLENILVHTGQHYDESMSTVFFNELRMPKPDTYLGVGSGSHAEQTARVMVAFERICLNRRPQLVVVAGDVNSTLACALVAAKVGIPVAHIEAGLRSFDRSMPEELNRLLTDHVSELLFTSEPSGGVNLRREGIHENKIHFVGNCMIDSLRTHLDVAVGKEPWKGMDLTPGTYGVVTLHRPAVVDNPERLEELRTVLTEIARSVPLVFPLHPRTRKQIEALGRDWSPIQLTEPLGYLEFLGLMAKARIVLTDSGGIQEETTALGVPCATLRDNTERPATVEVGTNKIAGTTATRILPVVKSMLAGEPSRGRIPDLWDGHAAIRIGDALQHWLQDKSRL